MRWITITNTIISRKFHGFAPIYPYGIYIFFRYNPSGSWVVGAPHDDCRAQLPAILSPSKTVALVKSSDTAYYITFTATHITIYAREAHLYN